MVEGGRKIKGVMADGDLVRGRRYTRAVKGCPRVVIKGEGALGSGLGPIGVEKWAEVSGLGGGWAE